MAPKTSKTRIAIEIEGTFKVSNIWVDRIKAIVEPNPIMVLERGDWYEVLEGSNAAEALSEVGELIKTLLEGGTPSPPSRVDWVRVEAVED